MADRVLPRRLSALDALFLYIETPEAPLHLGGLDVLDGDMPAEALVERLRARIHEAPRYTQRVRPAPLGIGHPLWEDDPDFDVRHHVFDTRLPAPGSETALEHCASELFARHLDRHRPLWELHVIRGLQAGRTALLSKIHHCMVDGISGVELMNIVFDSAPGGSPPATGSTVRTRPSATLPRLLFEAAWDTGTQVMDAGGALLESVVALPTAMRDLVAGAVAQTTVLAGAALTPVARLPFNRSLSGARRLAWMTLPRDQLKAIAHGSEGTVNDVALAILADGIGRMLTAGGETIRSRWLRILVPVNVRREEASGLLGNRVSMIPVEVPLDAEPLGRLRETVQRTRAMKQAGIADLVEMAAHAGELAPAALYAAALSLAASASVLTWSAPLRAAPFLTANLVCTNVPGPPIPLYGLGHRVLAHYPLVPLGFETGLNCALFTYNHVLHVGLVADAAAIDDLGPLKSYLQAAFVDLCHAAGVEGPPAPGQPNAPGPVRRLREESDARNRNARPRARRPASRHPRRS